MIIGVDARGATDTVGGIGLYSYYLISNLLNIPGREIYIAFTDSYSPILTNLAKKHERFKVVTMEFPSSRFTVRAFWDQFYLSYEMLRRKIDVFWGPYMVLPLIGNIPSVVTIHDLTFLEYPSHYPQTASSYWKHWAVKAIKRAVIVIADSWSTKCAIERVLPETEDKIKVVYPGIKEIFINPPERAHNIREILSKRFKINNKYILAIGGVEALHKNLDRALRAFAILKSKYSIEHQLAIVDRFGPKSKWLFETAHKLGISESIVPIETVNDIDLRMLYQGADLFLTPSLNEGFGFPLLEAMACGTPIAASNRGSIPEILCDSGVMFDPESTDCMIEKVRLLLDNVSLRKNMIRLGYRRYKDFDWESAAINVLGSLREAYHRCRNKSST